jgi:hypothetical protein
MSEDQKQTDVVKGSSLGLILGILVVVAVVMLILNTSFIQEKLGKKSEEAVTEESGVGGFEIIDEPEITLLDEIEMEEVEEVLSEEVDTHEPVDTAVGDLDMTLVSTVLLIGSGLLLLASKKLAK